MRVVPLVEHAMTLGAGQHVEAAHGVDWRGFQRLGQRSSAVRMNSQIRIGPDRGWSLRIEREAVAQIVDREGKRDSWCAPLRAASGCLPRPGWHLGGRDLAASGLWR